jgi:hypothetical protein
MVCTIRLTICKQRLMMPKYPRDARDVDQNRAVTRAARQSSSRVSLHRRWTAHLIRQPTALLLLPALRNSLLLVASSSRQVKDVMMVSSGSTRTLIE